MPEGAGCGILGASLVFLGAFLVFGYYYASLVEVRGDPHEVFRPREGGLTRIRCFRVVVVVSSSSGQKSAKIDENQLCPE